MRPDPQLLSGGFICGHPGHLRIGFWPLPLLLTPYLSRLTPPTGRVDLPPRTAFAFGLAAGLSLVYFVGLFQGLGLGTLLLRSAIGGLAFGAFCALLVFMLGDPFEIPPEPQEPDDQGEGQEGEGQATPHTTSRDR
jgi:hypothetical protein